MAINTGKVVVGGLAAGLVLNVIDFVLNMYVFVARFKTELDQLNTSLMPKLESGATTAAFVVLDFVMGVLLVLTYAAIRPRFGPGAGTAVKAGLLVWAISGITWAFTSAMGMFSWGFFAMSAVASLCNMLVAAYVGARLYKED